MRIYELYALLDEGDVGPSLPRKTLGLPIKPSKKRSLGDLMKDSGAANDYSGPWALQTMGGAGG